MEWGCTMVHPKPLKPTANHKSPQRCDKHFYAILIHIGKSFGLSMSFPLYGFAEVNCPQCKQSFCTACTQPAHLGTCEDAELQRMDPQLREMIKKENWKRCPVCRHLCERESGCNFMTCPSEQCNFGSGKWTV